ncbi:SLC13 family permease [Desulfopila sp. IMCC35008]|uniref:SLC13 family permease n=1 Tax=Desulfopila sp. IMCC35008 TaxID=2653858 RepID=UPI0013D2E7B3|nr:SLC13 family permease [Desulfopila sp. IMCC35008]
MDSSLIIVLSILTCAGVLFVTGWIRSDIVGLLTMSILMVSGILTVNESLAGFSEPAVIIIAGMFIISEALVCTGAAQRLAAIILRLGRSKEKKIIPLMMCAIGGIGAFMSSTAVMAIFLPIGLSIARKTNLNKRRLLMPLSVAALISGMMTLVATAPNLIVSQALKERQLAPFNFFSFTPFGCLTLAVVTIFMLAVGRGLLSSNRGGSTEHQSLTIRDLLDKYNLLQRFSRLRVLPASPLIDRAVARMGVRDTYGIELIGFEKHDQGRIRFENATAKSVFHNGDALYVSGKEENILRLREDMCLSPLPLPRVEDFTILSGKIGLAEVMAVPDSTLVGKTLRQSQIFTRHKVTVIAIRRRGQAIDLDYGDVVIESGDVLLINGAWKDILKLRNQIKEFVLLTLPEEYKDVAKVEGKIRYVIPIMAMMVGAMALTGLHVATVVVLTVLALIFTRCVELKTLYNTIEWPTVVLVASILPLATALDKTGGTALISEKLMSVLSGQSEVVMVLIVFGITVTLGYFISNTATAIILAPIVIDAALNLGVSPHALAMTVAIACSAAYAMPVSSPVNMLVLEPGRYTPLDFLKIGVPLQLLTMFTTLLLVWVLFL